MENLKISIRTVGKVRNWPKRNENQCEIRVLQILVLSLILLNGFFKDFAEKKQMCAIVLSQWHKAGQLVRTEEVETSDSNGPSDQCLGCAGSCVDTVKLLSKLHAYLQRNEVIIPVQLLVLPILTWLTVKLEAEFPETQLK